MTPADDKVIKNKLYTPGSPRDRELHNTTADAHQSFQRSNKVAMNIVILGCGGHAKVIIDIIECARQDQIVGVIDRQRVAGEQFCDYEVLGRDEDLPQLVASRSIQGAVIAVGDNSTRAKIARNLQKLAMPLKFPTAIHPMATIARSARLGQGTVAMAGSAVNSDTTIGDFCILNTNCSIDHDCQIGDFASFAPNSCAGGSVEVGPGSAIGLGANIIHNRQIGADTIVGAGALVVKDLPPQVVAYGIPAHVIRPRFAGDSYL